MKDLIDRQCSSENFEESDSQAISRLGIHDVRISVYRIGFFVKNTPKFFTDKKHDPCKIISEFNKWLEEYAKHIDELPEEPKRSRRKTESKIGFKSEFDTFIDSLANPKYFDEPVASEKISAFVDWSRNNADKEFDKINLLIKIVIMLGVDTDASKAESWMRRNTTFLNVGELDVGNRLFYTNKPGKRGRPGKSTIVISRQYVDKIFNHPVANSSNG